jgi:hypothetical protein
MSEAQRPPLTPDDLLGTGEWRELPSALDTRILVRLWPDDSVDTLAVRSTGEALGERTDPAGKPVWRHFAATSVVIVLLWTLPPPGESGAPNEVLPNETTDQDI